MARHIVAQWRARRVAVARTRGYGPARRMLWTEEMLDPSQTVAQIVLDHSETASVFQRHKIDYCCHGDQSVAQACGRRGLDLAAVLDELDAAIAERSPAVVDPRTLTTAQLIAHIVTQHHDYLRKSMPFAQGIALKVARVHGEHNPKLVELSRTVRELADTLLPHLADEERTLFPALRTGDPDRVLIARELAAMHADHLAVGTLLGQLRAAADDYAIPDWACRSYRALFAELEQMERDILRHVHLENHVLTPRFVAAEGRSDGADHRLPV